MGARFHIAILITGYLYYGLDSVKGGQINRQVCTGQELTLTCQAYKRVKPANYRNLWWRVRGPGSTDWNTSITYCDDKLKCTNYDLSAQWKKVFSVKDTKDGSLTIKLLQETNLEFGCEVDKIDSSSPEWDVVSIRVDRCYTTQENVTACVGQQKILECDSVRRVDPLNFRDLQWSLGLPTRWENLSYCNRTFGCSVSGRKNMALYKVKNTSLILLNVKNNGMKEYGCEVLKMDQSTPEFHIVNVFPVDCHKTTPSGSSSNQPSVHISSTLDTSTSTETLPTNEHTTWPPTNSTIHALSSAGRIVWREAATYGLLVILGSFML